MGQQLTQTIKQDGGMDDPRVVTLVADYVARLEAGEHPDREDLLAQHPEIAGALRGCLDGLELIHNVAPQLQSPLRDSQNRSVHDLSAPRESDRYAAVGDFRIVREIGRGGMGVVYEAEQLSLRRKVAVKVLPFAAVLDPRHLQRFKNEALAAAQLDHPHIVNVLGVGCERGVHHYAMRFVEGHTLAAVIAEVRQAGGAEQPSPTAALASTVLGQQGSTVGPVANEKQSSALAALSPADSATSREFFRFAAKLGRDVAGALDYAHEHGVVHRDIKPSNLMLDTDGKVWVTDFGLAHIETDVSLTMSGDLLGTLRYMSPEQVLAKRVIIDHRTDVYSLGVTLYELLTLQPAYPETDRQQLLQRISFEDPIPPRRHNSDIPADLETIVLKATAKNPHQRYETAQEFADDLQRFLQHEPIRAKRPTMIQRAAKWSRRHPAILWSAAAILLVSTIALAFISLDRRSRLQGVRSDTEAALRSTRAAIEEGELNLATTSMSAAMASLAQHRRNLPQLAGQVDALDTELQQRTTDAARYQSLLRKARDAQDRMTYGDCQFGDPVAEEALALFRALDGADSMKGLRNNYLSREEWMHAREVIYETLLTLGDFHARWNRPHHVSPADAVRAAHDALRYLALAEDIRPPTKALYWVRRQCYVVLRDNEAEQEAQRLYEQTPATIPLDHYLPGHTAAWDGDREAARTSYRAALRLQPDHYNSLFFLGLRHASDGHLDEARTCFTACMALRSDHVFAYLNRAEVLAELGDVAGSEADHIAATELAGIPAHERLYAHEQLARYYNRQGDAKQHRRALTKGLAIGEQLVSDLLSTRGYADYEAVAAIRNLARLYEEDELYAKQAHILEIALRLARNVDGITKRRYADLFANLVTEYDRAQLRSGHSGQAIQFIWDMPFHHEFFPILIERNDWPIVRDYFERRLTDQPGDEATLTYAAYMYLTCPDDDIRDIERAATLARQLISYHLDSNPSGLVSAGAILILAGREDEYQQLCRDVLSRLEEIDLSRIFATAALLNLQQRPADAAIRVACTLEKAANVSEALRLGISGMTHFRAGNLEKAATCFRSSLQKSRDEQPVTVWLGLALLEHQRGNTAEARKWFDTAEAWIETNREKVFRSSPYGLGPMNGWLATLLWYEEAKAALDAEPPTDEQDSQPIDTSGRKQSNTAVGGRID